MRCYPAAQTRGQNHADGCGLRMARTESMTVKTASISASDVTYRMPSSIVDERAIPEFNMEQTPDGVPGSSTASTGQADAAQ